MSGIEGLLHHNYNTAPVHEGPKNFNMSGIESTDLPTSKFVDENTSKTVDSKLPDGPDALKKLHPTLGIEKIQCAFCEISFCSASTLKLHLKKMHPGVKWLGYACGKYLFLATMNIVGFKRGKIFHNSTKVARSYSNF